ncbi:SDR family oxidoreductase [Paenibacillus sp. NPDC058071]|uniref:SDR family oxidoreductase n=1 Tax=Paenibacillus sp. NPDC058071 TaxID=3346326 RepID=UPI0036DBFF32
MKDKLVIVTGANSGMGLATTVALASAGAHVIMACRSKERGEQALEQAIQRSGTNNIELMQCDLASFASIRSFAEQFRQRYDRLDVLINNAGVISLKRQVTTDGYEVGIGVNHLGHFLLTELLLESLQQAPQGRIINVSSGAHKAGTIHFDNLNLEKGYNVWKSYSQSKLANILYTKELAKRLAHTNVTVNCLHPGAVGTNFGVDRDTGFGKRVMALVKPFFLTPEQGADTAIYLATEEEGGRVSGEYFVKRRIANVSTKAKDEASATRFWEWSERQVASGN